MNKIKFMKTRFVQTPMYGTTGSAGIDFFVPFDFPTVVLEPFMGIKIPSGIKVVLPPGTCLVAFNKSGNATKLQLQVGANVIDEDYRGEVHLHVINCSTKPVAIESGMKLVQFILLPSLRPELHWGVVADFNKTERGEGGFGSTGESA